MGEERLESQSGHGLKKRSGARTAPTNLDRRWLLFDQFFAGATRPNFRLAEGRPHV